MSRSDLAHSAPADLLAVRLHRYAAENVATFEVGLVFGECGVELLCWEAVRSDPLVFPHPPAVPTRLLISRHSVVSKFKEHGALLCKRP